MAPIPPLIRRLRDSEIELIAELCKSDEHLNAGFPKHEVWLYRALDELRGQQRIAFGAFLQKQDEHGYARGYELRACVVVKRSDINEAIELKNIAVRNRRFSQSDDQAELIQRRLIEKVIRFCEVREYWSIEVELPQHMKREMLLLMDLGFRVISLREKFETGKYVYLLQRSIGATYQGDPFDSLRIARWLARAIFTCKLREAQTMAFDETGFIEKFQFEQSQCHPALTQEGARQLRLLGEMLVVSGVASIPDITTLIQHFAPESHLKYVLCLQNGDSSLEAEYAKKGVTLIQLKLATLLAGGESSSMQIPFSVAEVAGIVTLLERDAIERIPRSQKFGYYLLSSRGKGLLANYLNDLSHDEPFTLLFYCPEVTENNAEMVGVVAVADILEVEAKTFEEEIDRAADEIYMSLSTRELKRYSLYSEEEVLYRLVCDNLLIFSAPLTLSECAGNNEVSNYLNKELIGNLASCAYIDASSVSRIRGAEQFLLPKKTTKAFEAQSIPSPDQVFIVYSRQKEKVRAIVREIAALLESENVSTIWDEKHLRPGDSLVAWSRKAMKDAVKVLVFISVDFAERKETSGTGIAHEWQLIQEHLYREGPGRFVPVLAEPGAVLPEEFNTVLATDLSDPLTFAFEAKRLIQFLNDAVTKHRGAGSSCS